MDESDCGSTCTERTAERKMKGGIREKEGRRTTDLVAKRRNGNRRAHCAGLPPDSAVTSLAPVVIKKDKTGSITFAVSVFISMVCQSIVVRLKVRRIHKSVPRQRTYSGFAVAH
ncbi:unnamed protein product [Heterotrigona itama]|uniref:Uncharacterized protein n=1 Tax=Heterotrigona itama TaxID=395501 RepID=A0A6V7HI17_9HYME|nr:unnamed protein product [Heterotrigona itama]